jgi:AcrR family transcriptional regulator
MTSAARLPRGRHELTRAAVAASQRSRLLDAMVSVVAQKGYTAATVGEVVAAAGVSRRTFYEQFDGKEDCFLAAHEVGLEFLLESIRAAVGRLPRHDWRARAEASVAAYLTALADRPEAAWAFTIEALGAGAEVLEQRARVLARWVAQWQALNEFARQQEPGVPKVTADELAVLVGGIEELVRECLRTRGPEGLPELGPRVAQVALAVLGDRR